VRRQLNIPNSDYVVAYYGRLVPEKGVTTLIKALGKLGGRNFWLMLNRFESTSEYAAAAAAGVNGRGAWQGDGLPTLLLPPDQKGQNTSRQLNLPGVRSSFSKRLSACPLHQFLSRILLLLLRLFLLLAGHWSLLLTTRATKAQHRCSRVLSGRRRNMHSKNS
jgi:hypothetical protein